MDSQKFERWIPSWTINSWTIYQEDRKEVKQKIVYLQDEV